MFAVRLRKTHGKQIVFAVRLVLAHGKDNAQTNGCEREYHRVGEKMFAVRQEKNARQTISLPCVEGKTHGKHFFCRVFFFAVCYGENAR
jgi:predicted DNA-binding protein (MmcQ/YjbR family)